MRLSGFQRPLARVLPWGGLTALLALGAWFRFHGLDHGGPFVYHPDEAYIAKPALQMVANVDWNPHVFFYPSLVVNLQALLVAIGSALWAGPLTTDQSWLFGNELLPEQFAAVAAGRTLVAMSGVATIAVAFAIGRSLSGSVAGLAAGATIAIAPLHIESSRYLTTDVPVTLFCALTALAAVRAWTTDRVGWWVAAGALVGLATSTKWNGAAVAIVPAFLYLAAVRRGPPGRLRTPLAMLAAAAIALILTTPAVVFDTRTVLDYQVLQATLYAAGRYPIDPDGFGFNLRALPARLSGPLALGAYAGLLALVISRRAVALAFAAFIGVNLVILSLPAVHYARNLLPVLPFLALGFGALCQRGWNALAWSGPRADRRRRLATNALVLGVVGALAVGSLTTLARDRQDARQVGRVDTRTVARVWMLEHIPHNTIIAREQYTPQVTPSEFRLRNRTFLWQRPLDWYCALGVRYLVTSSSAYGRFHGDPKAPIPSAFYDRVFALPEVFRIDPGPDHPGATVRIFRLTGC
jgi:4-amino-4-deoxy-L-arabinose transferase-like glycosyltransferase